MKKLVFIFFLFTACFQLQAQKVDSVEIVDPQDFPVDPASNDDAVYTREGGTNRKITFQSIADWIRGLVDGGDVDITPSGNLTSTDAQAAFEELQSEIDALVADPGGVEVIATYAALQAKTGMSTGDVVYLSGYHSESDGAEGFLVYRATGYTANGGSIYTSSSTGTWNRLEDEREVQLKWFGATGDGSTNDAAAINSWLDVVETGKDGFVNPCDSFYRYAATPTYRVFTSRIYGVGEKSCFQPQATRGEMFLIGSNSKNFTLENFKILADSVCTNAFNDAMIYSYQQTGIENGILKDLIITQEDKPDNVSGSNGIQFNRDHPNTSFVTNVRVINCRIELKGSGNYGIRFKQKNVRGIISKCIVKLTPTGLNSYAVYGSSELLVDGNESYGGTHSAFACSPCNDAIFSNNYAEGVHPPQNSEWEAGYEAELKAHGSDTTAFRVIFENNIAIDCHMGMLFTMRDSTENSKFPSKFVVDGFIAEDMDRSGIAISDQGGPSTFFPPENLTITNFQIYNSCQLGIERDGGIAIKKGREIIISDGIIKGSGEDGIFNSGHNVSISNVKIKDIETQGIMVEGASGHLQMDQIHVDTATSQGIFFFSTLNPNLVSATLTNSIVERCGGQGVTFSNQSARGKFTGNEFRDNGDDGLNTVNQSNVIIMMNGFVNNVGQTVTAGVPNNTTGGTNTLILNNLGE